MNEKELRRLMPADAQDVEAARRFVSLGPDVLMPVASEMLRRLPNHNSPVSEVYCDFFAQHGDRFVSAVDSMLARTSMNDLKNIIVTRILVHWPRDALAELSGTMTMLVTHTDFFNTDLVLIKLLRQHQLADEQWLWSWLKFKRNRLAQLSCEADRVASLFESGKHAP